MTTPSRKRGQLVQVCVHWLLKHRLALGQWRPFRQHLRVSTKSLWIILLGCWISTASFITVWTVVIEMLLIKVLAELLDLSNTASSDPTRIKFSPYTRFFSSFHCRNQSAKNADLCDAVAASLQCTDPRYLFVYPISLMTLRATFIITGVGSTRRIKFPDGAVTAWLSVWPRTYSCKRSHVLLQRSVLTAAQQLSIT